MSFTVAVAGASGYAGGELLRLLAAHPEFEVRTVTAKRNAGQPLIALQPHLRSLDHLRLHPSTPEVLAGHDVVFLALPHGASGALAAALPEQTLVIDCGADHRLSDPAAWAEYYGGEHAEAWTYGLPELVLADGSRQRAALEGARRIAVPGCNVTAVTLALAPGVRDGLIEGRDLVAVLAVGTSGAGRSLSPELLASEVAGSASAYRVGGTHRHTPEIVQNLEAAGGSEVTLSFTPVLVPMSRGILATSTARLVPGVEPARVRDAWASAYADEPFVHLLPEGTFPRSGDTTGSNTASIGLAVDERVRRVVAISAIDNLGKGTAGGAVQCANLALGLPETTGLTQDGVAP